ncbi:unnamed protein product [Coccothraustes coccothraustes]
MHSAGSVFARQNAFSHIDTPALTAQDTYRCNYEHSAGQEALPTTAVGAVERAERRREWKRAQRAPAGPRWPRSARAPPRRRGPAGLRRTPPAPEHPFPTLHQPPHPARRARFGRTMTGGHTMVQGRREAEAAAGCACHTSPAISSPSPTSAPARAPLPSITSIASSPPPRRRPGTPVIVLPPRAPGDPLGRRRRSPCRQGKTPSGEG